MVSMVSEGKRGVGLRFLNRPEVNLIPDFEHMAIVPKGGNIHYFLGFYVIFVVNGGGE